jgi:PAS domain S-box-containing protein
MQSRTAWLRESAFPVRDPLGELLRVTHIARDVTWQLDTTARLRAEISRRTDAERSLSDATVRLQALIATANDAVVTIDAQSQIIDWNNAAERMFGWSRVEAIGQTLTELIIPPVHRRMHNAGIERFLRDGSSHIFNRRVETTALRRSGEEFDAELSVWPVRAGDQHTFSSFIRDISRRKAAERALADSEAKYRTVVENVSEGILVTAQGRILYANPRALALTGMTEHEATTRPFIDFIHPDDRERVLGNTCGACARNGGKQLPVPGAACERGRALAGDQWRGVRMAGRAGHTEFFDRCDYAPPGGAGHTQRAGARARAVRAEVALCGRGLA